MATASPRLGTRAASPTSSARRALLARPQAFLHHKGVVVKIVHSCVLIATTAWCAHASAQMSPFDVEVFEENSGTYSVACGKADAARVTVAIDSVTIEVGTKRLSGKPAMAAVSTFGGAPPPEYADFHVELLTDIAILYVMKGKDGTYLVIADFQYPTNLEKQFGKGTLAGRFKRCA